MGVHIDESGRDHAPGRIDRLAGFNIQIDANINDSTIVDCHIAAKPGATGTIDYAGVLYQ